jgi:small subunit ribosomal protein S20
LEAAKNSDETVNDKLSTVYKLYDKAVSKGIVHKNTAARKKSRLTRNINKLSSGN